MKALAIRLHPHQDLLVELDAFACARQLNAACILCCVGSLRHATLRYADQKNSTDLEGKFEIVSLTGTLSQHGSHIHISIADGEGQTLGGHLLEGCRIYTTAEIVIGVLPKVNFTREFDPETGFEELSIGSTVTPKGDSL
ncbi:PPC domain-containing DNA-binding protein [uncultured Desulfuromusa sp.]|uniref:PPC domain-containing DNA-binding protein n=1 Tax=uncultured Desulfuromusa sp. TaxID=219183 RepID=UPI002AA79C3B|nr:PPC domain-containing DNA-binding protein [uncultured Desulfuromusa sp.]